MVMKALGSPGAFSSIWNGQINLLRPQPDSNLEKCKPEKSKLFAVNRRSNTLTVMDKFATRREATIRVESKPYDAVSTE
jgi:YVTN family beta-propeller protein